MPSNEELVTQLAQEVTRTTEPPSDDLRMALEQLINEVTTGDPGSKPVDWAYFVSEAVALRHGGY